jgi:colanic acid/amylovoran biosynthesis protein
MHACIAAFSSGVPVAPVAYSRKFSGLFGGVLGYPHMVPVKGMSTDAALGFLRDCLERREALKADIVRGQAVVADALAAYDAVLRDVFEAAVRLEGASRRG